MYCFEIHDFLVDSPPPQKKRKKKKESFLYFQSCFSWLWALADKEWNLSLSLSRNAPPAPRFSLLLTTTAQKSAALKQNFLQCVMLLLKFNDIQG